MKNIEAEIRSFLTEGQYDNLKEFFDSHAQKTDEDEQTTFYYKGDQDVRIQKNSAYSKIWLKKGKIHDEAREEIEVRAARDDFEKLERLFDALGYEIEIKWFRSRLSYEWQGISVALDRTRGYGYILELEKLCSPEEKDATLEELKARLAELNVIQTPREEFDQRYMQYTENWKTFV